MYKPAGVMTSMVTSFDSDGKIDEDGLRDNVEFQRNSGVRTIVVLGGTGEPMSLTAGERERVMQISCEAAGTDLKVVASALVGNPDEVSHDVDVAYRHGAAACMITTPPFVRPSESDVYQFLTEIASRSKLPLIVFNVPSRAGFLMSPSLIERAAKDIDLLVGIKESSRDIVQFSEVRQRTPSDFACLQGVDSLYLASLALGGDGGILAAAAAFPEHCIAIDDAMSSGDLSSARKWHYRLMQVVPVLYEASHPAPLKLAIETRGLPAGRTRPPLYEIPADLADRVKFSTRELAEQLSNQ